MKRRHVLALLGIGGTGAIGVAGYQYGIDTENADAQLQPLKYPNPTETLGSINYDQLQLQTKRNTFSLVTEPLSDSVENHPSIERFAASPVPDQDADQIKLTVASNSDMDKVSDEFQVLLNLGNDAVTQTQVEDQTVQFSGGETGNQAAFIASHSSEVQEILIARGSSVDSAKYSAENWNL
jgi:hypothetical protein